MYLLTPANNTFNIHCTIFIRIQTLVGSMKSAIWPNAKDILSSSLPHITRSFYTKKSFTHTPRPGNLFRAAFFHIPSPIELREDGLSNLLVRVPPKQDLSGIPRGACYNAVSSLSLMRWSSSNATGTSDSTTQNNGAKELQGVTLTHDGMGDAKGSLFKASAGI